MIAKDGNPTRPDAAHRRLAMCVLALVAATPCGCTKYFRHSPRPSVEQLMQSAIDASAQARTGQQSVVAAAPLADAAFVESKPGAEPVLETEVEADQPVGGSAGLSLVANPPTPADTVPLPELPMPTAFGPSSRGARSDGSSSRLSPPAAIAQAPADLEGDDPPPVPDTFRSAVEILPAPEGTPEESTLATPTPAVTPEPDDTPRINEEFFETDIREAVSILASEVEADVLMDDKVRGVVNATINDATFDEALEKVLLPLGYVYGRRENGQYIISPPDPDSPLFPYISRQVEYRPKYVDAETLLAGPPTQMAPFVRVVEESNVLLIEAPTQFVDLILDRVQRLDRPAPQVELEAIVCVVSPDSGFRFGLDWGHAVTIDGNDALSTSVSGLALSANISPRGLKRLFDDFSTTSAFVRLLAENDYLTIRAAPRVMAQDGKKANITIGSETYFAIQPGGAGGDNSAIFFQQDVQEVQSGISLEITPHIRDKDVTIEIAKAEVSEDISASLADGVGNAFPIINRRSVSTTVHVEDGKTIIIGGLMQRETVNRKNRVPGLSGLPGVGYLFKSVEKLQSETEVVIFISPRIVQPDCCDPEPAHVHAPPP